jgi:hypothetical protein
VHSLNISGSASDTFSKVFGKRIVVSLMDFHYYHYPYSNSKWSCFDVSKETEKGVFLTHFLFYSDKIKMDISKVLLVALVLAICALVLQLIGLASPYWMTFESGSTKVNSGLWRTCSDRLGVTTCVDSVDFFLDDGMYLYTF